LAVVLAAQRALRVRLLLGALPIFAPIGIGAAAAATTALTTLSRTPALPLPRPAFTIAAAAAASDNNVVTCGRLLQHAHRGGVLGCEVLRGRREGAAADGGGRRRREHQRLVRRAPGMLDHRRHGIPGIVIVAEHRIQYVVVCGSFTKIWSYAAKMIENNSFMHFDRYQVYNFDSAE
jgi:hypothetical protein